jgi:hypothetical protein
MSAFLFHKQIYCHGDNEDMNKSLNLFGTHLFAILNRYIRSISITFYFASISWVLSTVPCSAIDTRKCEGPLSKVDAVICKGGEAKLRDDAMAATFFEWFGVQDKLGKERELVG